MTRPPPCPRPPGAASTYRLQLHGGFGFDDAAAAADYLAALGVSHVYLSPVLQAAPGSIHGYDVVDHSRLSDELGGAAAFAGSRRLREHGLGAVVDVVPNHMAVPTPAYLNAQLWSVLRDGPASPYAAWFDVDWAAPDRRDAHAGARLADRPGRSPPASSRSRATAVRTATAGAALLRPRVPGAARHRGAAARRAARPPVLPAGALAGRPTRSSTTGGSSTSTRSPRCASSVPRSSRRPTGCCSTCTRRDASTGCASTTPTGSPTPAATSTGSPTPPAARGSWSRRSSRATSSCRRDWRCAGTTGYDALQRVGGVLVDPAGAAPLTALLTELTGDAEGIEAVVEAAKREVVAQGLYAEVNRLVDLLVAICHDDVHLRDHTRRALHDARRAARRHGPLPGLRRARRADARRRSRCSRTPPRAPARGCRSTSTTRSTSCAPSRSDCGTAADPRRDEFVVASSRPAAR